MSKQEKKLKSKVFTVLGIIFTILLILSFSCITGLIIYLNVLPIKFLIPAMLVILLIEAGIVIVLTKPKFKKWFKVIIMIISSIIITGCIIGSVYLAKTLTFMDKINSNNNTTTESYYVLVRSDSEYNKIEDVKDKTIGVFKEETSMYTDAIKELNKVVSINTQECDSVFDLKDKLLNKKLDVVLMSSIEKETIIAEDNTFESKVKSIYEIKVEDKSSEDVGVTKISNMSKDVFTIYISGIDTYGNINTRSRSDVNMLATVNPNTHEILLTSIPRDYYVQLHGTTGTKDKLTHAGIYGIDMSVKTIQDFMNIDINYYVRVNFSTLIKVVDLIGGIDVYSDTTFVPWTKGDITIKKGNVHMNGATALAFARERHAYQEGDRHRVQNQQDVITAIIKKLTGSTALLTKYTSLLDSVSSSFQTNIGMDDISNLIKLQLDKMPTWTIKKYSLNGTDSRQYTYSMGKQSLYVMIPDQSTITNGRDYIKGMTSGKKLSELGL